MFVPHLRKLLCAVIAILATIGTSAGVGHAALIGWDLRGGADPEIGSSLSINSGGFDLTVTGGIIASTLPLGLIYTDVARSVLGIGTCSESASEQQCALMDTSEPPGMPNDEFLRIQLPGPGWAPVALAVVDISSGLLAFGANVANPEADDVTALTLTLLDSEELSSGVFLLGLGFPGTLEPFEYLFLSNGGSTPGGIVLAAFAAIQVPEPSSTALLGFALMLISWLRRARG